MTFSNFKQLQAAAAGAAGPVMDISQLRQVTNSENTGYQRVTYDRVINAFEVRGNPGNQSLECPPHVDGALAVQTSLRLVNLDSSVFALHVFLLMW